MPVPILILSDAPDSGTGLGRITKDLAYTLSTMPEFRVATFGRGGTGSRQLPWPQYTFAETEQWGEGLLIKVCEDFSRDDEFIILTVWDPSRLFWFGHPETLPEGPLKDFLQSGKFQRWGYFPVDAYGPDFKLSILGAKTVAGYDRILAYSQFGKRILEKSVGCKIDFIPHGIDGDTFKPMGREEGREILGVKPEQKLVGCVMTNQARKDWGTWARIARNLLTYNKNYMFWVHTDLLERYWSLPALIEDFGLQDHVKITQAVTDQTLAKLYSACDLTILPSLGEGFGYPIAESLACGVPCIHHDYGAGHEIISCSDDLIEETDTTNWRLDTINNVYRPILHPEDWSGKIHRSIKQYSAAIPEEVRATVSHLFWPNLRPVWKKWFKDGL